MVGAGDRAKPLTSQAREQNRKRNEFMPHCPFKGIFLLT
jgi:hypothetical protein